MDEQISIDGQIDALIARVPAIAPRIFDLLRCGAWQGWKPQSVVEVENYLYRRLRDAAVFPSRGISESDSAGVVVRIGRNEAGPVVSLAFECAWEAMIDPFEGGRPFVVPD